MKKLITSTIIVLPLLLLAIMLVSGAITSMITHVYVESVEFTDSDTLVLVMSDEDNPPTALLGVNVFPMKAESRDLAFSVDDGSIATVDASGVLTAKFYGETYVSVASAENAAATARRKVIVTDTAVHALAIGGYDEDMYEGRSQQLSVAVYPREAINQSVTWESSDTRVATVSANGTVTAKGAGKATITAISDDNNEIKASVEITGHSKITDIEVDRTLVVTALDESVFPVVEPVPASSDITLTYRTDNPEIATVDEGGNITFLKEGHVTVTVTATDFGGTTIEKKKEYTSTAGYYILPLFEQREYTVDYDYYKNANKALPIPFGKALDGSYREFLSVTYSVDNVLTFDETTKEFRFVGPMPTGTRSLKVTVNARIYDTNNGTLTTDYVDGFTLNVLRNASAVSVSYMGKDDLTSIPVSQKTLTFTEAKQNDGSFAVINVDPENHTNKIAYSLVSGEGIAAITPAGVLTFNEAGTVKVRIEFKDDKGEPTAQKEIDVTYTPLEAGEKDVWVSETEQKMLLLMQSDGTFDTGVIRLAVAENADVTCEVATGEKVVSLDESEAESGVWRVTPLSGGFATVKITETADGKVTVYYIKIYVDRTVSADDFTVWFNDNLCKDKFTTSLGSVRYDVTLEDNNGSTAGKKLYVSFGETRNGDSSGTITFAGKDTVTVTFGTEYTDEARGYGAENGLLSVVRTVTTTLGTLRVAPTVTYDGGKQLRQSGDELTFENIGDKIVLNVEGPFDPEDFDLAENAPSIARTEYVDVSMAADGTKITLTAKKVCAGKSMSLSIGGKTFTFGVTVNALAEKLIVSCGETQMTDGNSYDTLLGTLTFDVKLAERTDGQQISNGGISYSVGGGDYLPVGGGKVEVNVDALTEGKQLLFRSDDMAATLAITIRKVTLADFGLELYVNKSVGDRAAVGTVESADKAAGEVTFALPSDMQSALTIKVVAETDNLLGGFGTDEEFGKMFSADMPGGDCNWRASYEAGQGEIIVTGSFAGAYKRAITVKGFGKSVKINLSHITLASIEFTGFDSGKPEDVYKGYQQVRVFAKHSYYDGTAVDYFRVPLVALSDLAQKTPADPALLTWKLTRYTENKAVETVASQFDGKVTYDGNEYTIEKDGEEYVLKDSEGNIVSGQGGKNAQGITWVDIYSEKEQGIARIYFGAFGGLSESDVQNDYFGNFGDRSAWTKKEPEGADNYDGSGRTFTPSSNAYSFLRVEAGDGALNGKNCHFNFNVLDDFEGGTLVNVFDAAGYYANANIVLQENLYGPGELGTSGDKFDKAIEKGLFLENVSLGKTLIYGNGYQVNLEAKTAAMSQYSESDGIAINRAYNTVIKCANPTEEISKTKQKMVFRMAYAYYCDLSYYYKFNPSGNTFYAKNTVFSHVPKTAVQLYYNGLSFYAENIVMTECGTAIQADNASEQNVNIYYKGSIDILNYFNQPALSNLNELVGSMFEYVAKSDISNYFEWHGKNISATAEKGGNNVDKVYVNVLAYAVKSLAGKTHIWTDGGYKTLSQGGGTLSYGAKIINKALLPVFGDFYYALTYEMLDGGARLDNATAKMNGKQFTGTADLNSLFSNNRYIRLQCEFKEPGVKNYDHIKWHQQEVYRDKTLIAGRLSHIDDLKKSLANTRWDDGSGVDGEGNPYEPNSAAAVNTLFAVPMSGRRED